MPLLATLKTETTDSHVGLENSMDVFRKVRSVADYRDLLSRFFTLYEPLEARLGQAVTWTDLGWDFDGRRKTELLHKDLRALDVAESDLATWPRCEQLPEVSAEGAAVGCLYVLEGSTLGGQMISKRFHEAFGITPDNGGAFFHGYGPETGHNWRSFGQWAEARNVAAGGALTGPAVTAARATFDTFAAWLNR